VSGYKPNRFTITKGIPVRWVITSQSQFSCAVALSVPSLGIQKNLKKGENIIEFTPQKTGRIPFSCSMGMYRGYFDVVETSGKTSGITAQAQAAYADNTDSTSTSCGGRRPSSSLLNTDNSNTISQKAIMSGNKQIIKSIESDSILSPDEFTVSVNIPAEWTITPDSVPIGCMVGFYNEELGIAVDDTYPSPTTINFIPTEKGDYEITCPMGMGRALIHVQ